MKAKELAEELLNYPDFDVELTYMVFKWHLIRKTFRNLQSVLEDNDVVVDNTLEGYLSKDIQ